MTLTFDLQNLIRSSVEARLPVSFIEIAQLDHKISW